MAAFWLVLILAMVAADSTEVNNVTPEDILKDSTIISSSTPSSATFGTNAGVQQRDFSFGSGGASFGSSWSGFGNQAPVSSNLLRSSFSGVPLVNSRSGSGFSESSALGLDGNQKDESIVSQQQLSSSLGGSVASGVAALASDAFKGSNNVFLKSANGLAWNSALPTYGYNGLNSYGLAGKFGSSWSNGLQYPGYNPSISIYQNGYGNIYGGALTGIHSHGHTNVDTQVRVDTTQQKHIDTLHTITKQVAVPQPYPVPVHITKTVPVPHPYPVQVSKAVPVPYNVNVPVAVYKPVPVKVPSPVPVPVHVRVPVPFEKPYPVPVQRIIQVPVEKPVYIRVPHPVAVRIAQPYPVRVAKPVPVQVPTPVVVKVPEVVNIHKVDYAVAPSYGVRYDGLYGGHGYYGAVSGGCDHNHGVQVANAASQLEAHNYFDQANHFQVGEGSSAQVGALADGSYDIQAANLVGAYQYPANLDGGLYPNVVDAKYAFKRETAKKIEKTDKTEKTQKKEELNDTKTRSLAGLV